MRHNRRESPLENEMDDEYVKSSRTGILCLGSARLRHAVGAGAAAETARGAPGRRRDRPRAPRSSSRPLRRRNCPTSASRAKPAGGSGSTAGFPTQKPIFDKGTRSDLHGSVAASRCRASPSTPRASSSDSPSGCTILCGSLTSRRQATGNDREHPDGPAPLGPDVRAGHVSRDDATGSRTARFRSII